MSYEFNGDVAWSDEAFQDGIDEGIRRVLTDLEQLYLNSEDWTEFDWGVRTYLQDNGYLQYED